MTAIRHGKRFWKQGEPLVWATGGTLTLVLLATALLIGVVLVNGLGVFWPSAVAEIALTDGTKLYGQLVQEDSHAETGAVSVQFKTANRELDPQRLDFRWIPFDSIQELTYPADVFVLERMENGSFFGVLERIDTTGLDVTVEEPAVERFEAALAAVRRERSKRVEPLIVEIKALNADMQSVQNSLLKARYRRKRAAENADDVSPELTAIDAQIERYAVRESELKGAVGRTGSGTTHDRSQSATGPGDPEASIPADARDRVGRYRAGLAAKRYGLLE